MIRGWLARNAGVAPVADRVAAMERELADARAAIASLVDRVAAAETHGAAAAAARDEADRRLRVLTRATRAGAIRLRRLLAEASDRGARGEALERELARLNAAVRIVENRMEADADQTKRSITGLLRRIETPRLGDRTGLAD